MNNVILFFFQILCIYCYQTPKTDIPRYYELVNQAEHLICSDSVKEAIDIYKLAFKSIDKPFGKDVYNLTLACALIKDNNNVEIYLQKLINNSDDLDFVKSKLVGQYITETLWDKLVSQKRLEYNIELRNEFKAIHNRDQLFRPMYETHDDTIKANEIINLNRINDLTKVYGFPSHQELGYTEYLRGQNHDIVLHHLAQRRSRDKSSVDLEPILRNATKSGRFDPETAIFYMNFQNDIQKGAFEVFSTWQFKHPLLPDSLNNTLWITKLGKAEYDEANRIRKEWNANPLEEITLKAAFLSRSNLPFIFTCVKHSIANLREDIKKDEAMEQYKIFSRYMVEYDK